MPQPLSAETIVVAQGDMLTLITESQILVLRVSSVRDRLTVVSSRPPEPACITAEITEGITRNGLKR